MSPIASTSSSPPIAASSHSKLPYHPHQHHTPPKHPPPRQHQPQHPQPQPHLQQTGSDASDHEQLSIRRRDITSPWTQLEGFLCLY